MVSWGAAVKHKPYNSNYPLIRLIYAAFHRFKSHALSIVGRYRDNNDDKVAGNGRKKRSTQQHPVYYGFCGFKMPKARDYYVTFTNRWT